jgi:predicted neuraminidase
MKLFLIKFCLFMTLTTKLCSQVPIFQSELIFEPDYPLGNHASCIIECPNGDLLACWFHGKGEKVDSVVIQGARKVKGENKWRPRFIMADTPDYPDHNPCMFVDPQQRLWLLWPTLFANRWETAIMKYKISSDYFAPDRPPNWEWKDIIHLSPQNFTKELENAIDKLSPSWKDNKRTESYIARRLKKAEDHLTYRLGWMTRAHPFILSSGRLIVPLYTDGYSISIMAITDDWGKHWTASQPLIGFGNIQPSLVQKNDGTLVAFMRENGRTDKIRKSESKDDGMTWSPVQELDLPNPGSALEVLKLQSGRWVLIYNDTVKGRYSLAVSISDDEGKSWKWTRHLEVVEPKIDHHYHYPSVIQSKDGLIHCSYTWQPQPKPGKSEVNSIKHAWFNEAWVMKKAKDY